MIPTLGVGWSRPLSLVLGGSYGSPMMMTMMMNDDDDDDDDSRW